jgi:hypothetical protein
MGGDDSEKLLPWNPESSPGRGRPPDHCKIKTIPARLTLSNRAEVYHRLFQQAFPSFFLTALLGGSQSIDGESQPTFSR